MLYLIIYFSISFVLLVITIIRGIKDKVSLSRLIFSCILQVTIWPVGLVVKVIDIISGRIK